MAKREHQTKSVRRGAREIADELTTVAGRVREALEGRAVTAADVDALRSDIAGLTARVTALESAVERVPPPAAPLARKPAARKPAAAKPPAPMPAAAKPVPAKPAAPPRPAAPKPPS